MRNYSLIILLLLTACGTSNKSNERLKENTLVVHELSDPDKLNPLTSQGAGSVYIEHSIFMYLLDVDKAKLDVTPWLAVARPTITELKDSEYKLKIDYEIRPEAIWDNGTPVTAYDVDFSYKATKNPLVDAEHQKPLIDFVTHIEIDKENPKKFSFYTSEVNYVAEFASGGTIFILPEYVYDPKQFMRNYTLKQLSNDDEVNKIREDENLVKFAQEFNSEKFQREKGFISGSGPYSFESWETGQRIVLKKKQDWWGNTFAETLSFENYPDKIIYEIINDKITAITAVKDNSIDLMRDVRPYDFKTLKDDADFNENFYMYNSDFLSSTYIGINMKHPILKDVKVRQALAHCVDVNQLIEVLNYGFAKPLASFIHPSKANYNEKLKPYDFNLEKAKQILEEAGWKDTDDDGILDKMIDGKLTPLKLSIKYNAGNDVREKTSLFLKNNAKTIGIDISISARDWAVYIDECTNHDFDLFILGWVQEAVSDDPKQLFHTESYNGGSNYPGFGDAYSDRLITNLRQELDSEKRNEMFKELQSIVHEEVPYIFLFSKDNLVVASKRFDNVKTYVARPGYEEREFILKTQKGVQP